MNKNKALLIIGGMGPEASGYLYKLLIDLAITEFGAKNNDDFPEIILHSVPVPDFISNDKSRKQALEMLEIVVKQANNLNISYISIACNTAHILLPKLQKVSKIPFVSMIEEVANEIVHNKTDMIGILGTPSTIKSRLYQDALSKKGVKTIIPNEIQLKLLENVIRNVIRGKINKSDQKTIARIANSLKKQGAKGIILGCTELPLVFPKEYFLPIYNSVTILAESLLRKYYKQNTMGEKL